MTQQQAQKELQEIERIADAILKGDTIYCKEDITPDNLHMVISLPRGQRCGTHYQQRSYALIKARELFNQNK